MMNNITFDLSVISSDAIIQYMYTLFSHKMILQTVNKYFDFSFL